MSSIKKFKQRPSLGEDADSVVTMSSMGPDFFTLAVNQMKLSLDKKNKLKNAKLIRGARDQLENLMSTRSKMLEKARCELASCVQDHKTGYAQDLDEIRSLWMNKLQLCEALSGLLSSEEEITRQLELDRERNSVVHLAQAKADCEEQDRFIASLD